MEGSEVPCVYARVELQAVNVGEQRVEEILPQAGLLTIIELRAADQIMRSRLENPPLENRAAMEGRLPRRPSLETARVEPRPPNPEQL